MKCMKKVSSASSALLLLPLLLVAGATVLVQGGVIVSEDLGSCASVDCGWACSSKHDDGIGKCDASNTCRCLHPGTPAPLDTECVEHLGIYTAGCLDRDCDDECSKKYRGGFGFCYFINPYVTCHCEHPC